MVDIFVITSNDSLINWFDGNKTKKQLRTKGMLNDNVKENLRLCTSEKHIIQGTIYEMGKRR